MLRDIRKNYQQAALNEGDLTEHPIELFRKWLSDAIAVPEEEPTAMTLSTCSNGRPDSRIVLLKEVQDSGFVFFTNYESSKGNQLSTDNRVALNFFWPKSERQIRVLGTAEKIGEQESADYFASRPRDSQLGAWSSPQSRPISGLELENNFNYYSELFAEKEIVKPPHWGGYRVMPDEIEFWQGRPNRLHDRIRYYRTDNLWKTKRLAP